jgi:hypothetical protein
MRLLAKILLELSNDNDRMESFNKIDNEKQRMDFVTNYVRSLRSQMTPPQVDTPHEDVGSE